MSLGGDDSQGVGDGPVKQGGGQASAAADRESDCTIPTPLSSDVIRNYVMPQPEHERRAIRLYLQEQAPDETVAHLEKVKTEAVGGRRIDAWDVHTDKNRWWVLTDQTNLYRQSDFPSLDLVFTFHVGLMARLAERHAGPTDHERARIAAAWRLLDQASDTLDLADEAEEFQATGMRCRAVLLAFMDAVRNTSMVPEGTTPPKADDFRQWSEIVARAITIGSQASSMRAFLRSIASATWALVSSLTHAKNAVLHDALIAVDATAAVLGSFSGALVRHESRGPERCPACRSYRMVADFRPDLGLDPPYVNLCASCGWSDREPELPGTAE